MATVAEAVHRVKDASSVANAPPQRRSGTERLMGPCIALWFCLSSVCFNGFRMFYRLMIGFSKILRFFFFLDLTSLGLLGIRLQFF